MFTEKLFSREYPWPPNLRGATFLTLKKLPTPKRGFSLLETSLQVPLNPSLSRHGLGPYRSTFRDMPKNPDSFIHSNFHPDIDCFLWRPVQVFSVFLTFSFC
ncbi:MAG: hypothetical protein II516_06515, partial [Treponema sp.]|nr:hypothetical protein [Treponema sp.]